MQNMELNPFVVLFLRVPWKFSFVLYKGCLNSGLSSIKLS